MRSQALVAGEFKVTIPLEHVCKLIVVLLQGYRSSYHLVQTKAARGTVHSMQPYLGKVVRFSAL
jgi:hypothetical protein